MPEPMTQGDDPLLTISDITREFKVSRQTLHTLRKGGAFPDAVYVPGSTRPRWRHSAVKAYFAANPLRQGARTDLQDPD